MPVIKNRELSSVGINTEVHPAELPLNGFTNGLNVRYSAGSVVARNADVPVMTGNTPELPVDDPIGPPLNLIEMEEIWYYGTKNQLWGFSSNSHYDVSRLEYTYEDEDVDEENGTAELTSYNSTSFWEFSPFGNSVVATNINNVPQIKTPVVSGLPLSTNFRDMPYWGVENVDNDNTAEPISWSTNVIRSYSGYLIAIGMIEASNLPIHQGGEYPQRIRWSSTAQPGQAPYSWNGATLETNAGWNDLSGITGTLIDGAPYQDSFILFTEKEVVQMRYVGGNSIFSFRKIFDEGGMLSRNCAVEFLGKQFVLGTNDVYIHDTSSKRSIVESQVKQQLFDEISSTNTDNVRVFNNELNNEIWIMYSEEPEGGTYYPLTRAAVWNYMTEVWSFFSLNEASGVAVGIRPDLINNADTWDGSAEFETPVSWNSMTTPWDGARSGFGNTGIVYSSYDGGFYLVDGSENTADYFADRWIEKTGIDLSAVAQGDIDQWVQLDRLLPIVTTTGTFQITVTGTKDQFAEPDWDLSTNETVIFSPDSDYKIDVRQSWSYLAIRIDFLDDVPYSLHALDFQVSPRGRR